MRKLLLRARWSRLVLGLGAFLGCASMAQAGFIVPSVLLTPGGPDAAPSLTSAAPGTLLASIESPFSFTTTAGRTSGSIESAVFLNPTGTVDFYYQVTNDATSVTSLSRESSTSFLGYAATVAYRVDGGSLPGGLFGNGTPGIIPVTADRDSSATTVGFDFGPAPQGTRIPPGTVSAILVISTNATQFSVGNATVIDGGAATVAAFQPFGPAVAVPEPPAMVLMGSGLLALALWRATIRLWDRKVRDRPMTF
jgi:hypothetical protein